MPHVIRTQRVRSPRLLLRFGVYTALTLAVAAAGFLWFVHDYARGQAERAVSFHAGFVSDTILRSRLQESDFNRPLDEARLAELDKLFAEEVLGRV